LLIARALIAPWSIPGPALVAALRRATLLGRRFLRRIARRIVGRLVLGIARRIARWILLVVARARIIGLDVWRPGSGVAG